MSKKLIPFSSQDDVEIHQGNFLVPKDWVSCGVVVYVAGGADLDKGQPVALAITDSSLSLCTPEGPIVSVPIGSIRDIKVADLTGMTIPVRTPSGILDMVPPRAKGISIKYELNPMGTQLELLLYTLSPKAAFEWVNVIQKSIYDKLSSLGQSGKISHR